MLGEDKITSAGSDDTELCYSWDGVDNKPTPFPTTPLRAQCAGASKRFCELVSHCRWQSGNGCLDHGGGPPNGWHTDPPRPAPVVRDDCSGKGWQA